MHVPHNIRMHLTGYSGLRPLPPAGDAGRSAPQVARQDGTAYPTRVGVTLQPYRG